MDELRKDRINKRSPKFRFRAVVRLVIENLSWLLEGDSKIGIKKAPKSVLTLEHICILHKAPEQRTSEEILKILKIIGKCKSFRKYPDDVKLLLATNCHFSHYGPGRIIVREGDTPYAIYFMMGGDAAIVTEKFDEVLQEIERNETGLFTTGDVFGEIALLHNIPRVQTVFSKTGVEFLILSRNDFNVVWNSPVKQIWDNNATILKKFEYFDGWDKIRVGEACMQIVIKNFRKDDTVLGDGRGKKNYVHIVIDGSCSLIEHFDLRRERTQSGHNRYVRKTSDISPSSSQIGNKDDVLTLSSTVLEKSVPSLTMHHDILELIGTPRMQRKSIFRQTLVKQPILSRPSIKANCKTPDEVAYRITETVFMKVAVFREKSCFSLGEPMVNRRIVADEPLTCLLIPSYLLFAHDNIWVRIKQFLIKRIPTSDVVYEELLRQRKWRKFKTEFAKPFLNTACFNWSSNIPYSLRIRDDYEYTAQMRGAPHLHM